MKRIILATLLVAITSTALAADPIETVSTSSSNVNTNTSSEMTVKSPLHPR